MRVGNDSEIGCSAQCCSDADALLRREIKPSSFRNSSKSLASVYRPHIVLKKIVFILPSLSEGKGRGGVGFHGLIAICYWLPGLQR